jgi:hypothetical protein
MKNSLMVIPLVVVVCFLSVICLSTALAQAEEQKAQFFLVVEEVVKPPLVSEYEDATKEEYAFLVEYNFPYTCYVYSTENYSYYYVWPVEEYADIGNLMNTWMEMVRIMGAEKWQALNGRKGKTLESYKFGAIRHRPDLSYVQENPRFKPEEANFMFWRFCHVLPGKESEFENICREWVRLDKEVNRSDSYDTFVVEMGTEMPLYFWTVRGKSAADFFNQQEVYGTKGGEKIMKLWNRTAALFKKLEDKAGMYRPDLSYTPKEK